MRKEELSGHNENCQQNASDLEGSLVAILHMQRFKKRKCQTSTTGQDRNCVIILLLITVLQSRPVLPHC